MREIKFRAWVSGRFHYWGFIEKDGHLCFAGITQSNKEPLTLEEVKNRSQQFTGLLDRTGKEIYEGDILVETGYPTPARCIWFEEGAGFVFQSIKNPDDVWCPNSDATGRGFEVIGNIHKNPELLK